MQKRATILSVRINEFLQTEHTGVTGPRPRTEH